MRTWLWSLLARLLAHPRVVAAIIAYAQRRPYSHLYGYMGRWWVMPRCLLGRDEFEALFPFKWLPFSIRLHHILRPDADLELHDHPWPFRTVILRGWYHEEDVFGDIHVLNTGDTAKRTAQTFHRITTVSEGGVWTLFIMGRWQHRWGFMTSDGGPPRKVYWKRYVSKNERGHLVGGDEAYKP